MGAPSSTRGLLWQLRTALLSNSATAESPPRLNFEANGGRSHMRTFRSRSATVQRAVALLRAHVLSDSYEPAWAEWEAEEDASLWEAVAADGLDGSR